MTTTTDKLTKALRDFLEEADAGIVATPCTREAAREALAALEAKPADAEFIDGDCVIAWVTEQKRASPAAPAAPSYITRDTIISGVRVVKVWPEGSDEPQILGTTIGGAPAAPAPVPLTHTQIAELWGTRSDGPSMGELVSFTRAIERAHGITKGGAA
jgi:hypothetical protein